MSKINYVKNEEKKKDKIFNFIIIGIVFVIVGALAVMVSNDKGLNGAKRIQEISYQEFQEKIKNDGYTIVLLASPTCSHCQNYKPFVSGLAEEYDFTVYYVDVSSKDLTEDNYNELHDMISATKDQFSSDGVKVIPTPTTAIFKNGQEIASELGDIKYDGLKKLLVDNGVIKDESL